jgi:3-methylcrotonyl-CoA carboxylase beta subunit
MSVLISKLQTRGEEFRANAARMDTLVAELREKSAKIAQGGSEAAKKKYQTRGKLLVRDRIDLLLDAGTPFLELSALAATGMYGDDVPSAGMVTGIGRISGQECVIVANDATVKGGTYYPLTVKKHLRAQQIALENCLPCVYLVDSGGAYLPMQDEVFPDQPVCQGDRADCVRDGVVHCGRRLYSGDVGRGDYCKESRHNFSRRAALS